MDCRRETLVSSVLVALVALVMASAPGCRNRCPDECFRAVECVEVCGGPVIQSSCCPCPTGTFDSIACGTDGAMPGGDGGGPDGAPGGDAASPPDGATGPGRLGDPCTSGSECMTGECGTVGFGMTDNYCIAYCDASDPTCPEMGHCMVPGDFAGWCLRPCDPGAPDCAPGLTCSMTLPGEFGCAP